MSEEEDAGASHEVLLNFDLTISPRTAIDPVNFSWVQHEKAHSENGGESAMASPSNLAACAGVAAAQPNSIWPAVSTTRDQRESATIFQFGSSAWFVSKERRFMTCSIVKPQEFGGKKTKQLQQQSRFTKEVSLKVASGKGTRGAEEGGGEAILDFDISRLEAYTERVRSEVLCVNAVVEDEEDQVIIFKGFSSSLTRATPDDLSEPILPPTAVILSIDRIRGPYKPSNPTYIQEGVSWQEFQPLLQERGV